MGFGLFEVARKRAASNRDAREWLSEMEIGLQSTKMEQIMLLTKFWVKSGQCGGEIVPRLRLKCCKRNCQTDFGLSLCVCPVARAVWRGKRVLRKVIPCRVVARRGDTNIIAVSMATHLQHANENSNELSATRAALRATLAGCQ